MITGQQRLQLKIPDKPRQEQRQKQQNKSHRLIIGISKQQNPSLTHTYKHSQSSIAV